MEEPCLNLREAKNQLTIKSTIGDWKLIELDW